MQKMPSMPSGKNRSVASKLKRNESGGGSGGIACVLVVVSLVLFTLSVREGGHGPLSTVRDVSQTIVSPLRMLGAGVLSPVLGMGNVMRNLTAEEATLSELKEENRRLMARNVELEEAELTAKRLQELLELKSTNNLQSVAARVIAGSTDSWSATVIIDKGSAAGLTVGMPVMDAKGAVGQLISCSAATSTVRLLSDEGSSVSAMVQASRAQGMVEGSPDGTLRLRYIRTDQTINVGDNVVTSGLGGVFPKGMLLGRVSSVESSPGSLYYDIVVEPFANPEMLEEVLVVTSLTEEQEATAEDIAIADAADLAAVSGGAVPVNEDDGAGSTGESETADADADAQGESEGEDANSQDEPEPATGHIGSASDDAGAEDGSYLITESLGPEEGEVQVSAD